MWLGLRTLRRIPDAVGETEGGEPVFTAEGARFVLRPTGRHFHRLVPCERCGRETVGSPILTRHDLHRAGNPMVCKACVRSSGLMGDDQAPPRLDLPQPPATDDRAPEP